MTITFVSVLVALLVGGIEVLGLIGDQLKIHGAVWNMIGSLNNNFGVIGFAIIGVFVMSWAVSIIIYRMNRYDEIEVAPALPTEDRQILS